jgi:hypothetical protein
MRPLSQQLLTRQHDPVVAQSGNPDASVFAQHARAAGAPAAAASAKVSGLLSMLIVSGSGGILLHTWRRLLLKRPLRRFKKRDSTLS